LEERQDYGGEKGGNERKDQEQQRRKEGLSGHFKVDNWRGRKKLLPVETTSCGKGKAKEKKLEGLPP